MIGRRELLAAATLLPLAGAKPSARATGRVDLAMLPGLLQPTVEVQINGQGPFRFAIDTGAQGRARADASLVERLKLPKVGEARGGDPSGRAPVAMDIVRLDTLALGPLVMRDVDAPSRDYRHGPGPADDVDGILGIGLFADHLLTLDYAARRVLIEPGALEADGSIPFTAPRGTPIVQITVAGQPVAAHVDSGNRVAPFIVPAELAARLPFAAAPRDVGRARTINNSYEIQAAPLDGDVIVGTILYPRPEIRWPAPGRDANIGSMAFAGKVLTIDQKNRRLRISVARQG